MLRQRQAKAMEAMNVRDSPYECCWMRKEPDFGFCIHNAEQPSHVLVDKQGIIRHKYVGVIDERVWREQLAALYQQLVDE